MCLAYKSVGLLPQSCLLSTQREMKNANHISKPDQFQVNTVMNWHTLMHIYKTLFCKIQYQCTQFTPYSGHTSLSEIINSKIKSSGTLGQGTQENKGRSFLFLLHKKRKKEKMAYSMVNEVYCSNKSIAWY